MELLRRIEMLSRKTRAFSMNIESSLRVGARVERLRLAELVRSVWLLNTDAMLIFEGYQGDLEVLDRRLSLIQQLDQAMEALKHLRAKTNDAPAKILDDARLQLEEATELLKVSTPEEIQLKQAEEIIQKTDACLRKITNENPQLAELLAGWVVKLKDLYDRNGPVGKLNKCQELRLQLKELFNVFDNRDYEDKSNIHPVHYHWLSSSIERLFVLRHYIHAWENADQEQQVKIRELEEHFIKYLKSRTWNALFHARQLRIEIQEDIFVAAIDKALSEEAASISIIPAQPHPNQLVRMSVQLNSKDLNTSTAKQEFTCVWDFGSIGKESGWEIWHYFPRGGKHNFSVSFLGPDGKMVKYSVDNAEVKIKGSAEVQPSGRKQYGERTKIEMIRLVVALLVAVLGLIVGAREKLMALDLFSGLVGVFVLGFGADTVKNIITKRLPGEE
jgi:hypothetical protein